MKLKFALVGLIALTGAATAGSALAMPLAALGQGQVSGVENVALVCGQDGCVRTAPAYRPAAYGVGRYGHGVGRAYAYNRGHRR
jgi:hypothetical protein